MSAQVGRCAATHRRSGLAPQRDGAERRTAADTAGMSGGKAKARAQAEDERHDVRLMSVRLDDLPGRALKIAHAYGKISVSTTSLARTTPTEQARLAH